MKFNYNSHHDQQCFILCILNKCKQKVCCKFHSHQTLSVMRVSLNEEYCPLRKNSNEFNIFESECTILCIQDYLPQYADEY